MEKLYSTIFIVDISQNPDEVDTVSSRIQQLIEDHGGIIKEIKREGKRRLTYLINKKSHGFYVEIEFTANSHLNIPNILEAEYRLNDRVLRHMTYIITPEELIQRAKRAKRSGDDEETNFKAKSDDTEERPITPVEELVDPKLANLEETTDESDENSETEVEAEVESEVEESVETAEESSETSEEEEDK